MQLCYPATNCNGTTANVNCIYLGILDNISPPVVGGDLDREDGDKTPDDSLVWEALWGLCGVNV